MKTPSEKRKFWPLSDGAGHSCGVTFELMSSARHQPIAYIDNVIVQHIQCVRGATLLIQEHPAPEEATAVNARSGLTAERGCYPHLSGSVPPELAERHIWRRFRW